MDTASSPPTFVTDLQAVYGGPSAEGFGSAIFWEPVEKGQHLEDVALETYRRFVGALWERYGEIAWMGPWRRVHQRRSDGRREILEEIGSLEDAEASRSAPLLLEAMGDPEKAHRALRAAVGADGVGDVAICNVGDGSAMSGLLVAAHHPELDGLLAVVAMMDQR